MDRSRPLWDARLVTGLEDGRWAVATKTHHAMVDGVGSVDAVYLLLDAKRRPRRTGELPEPRVPKSPGALDLLRGAASGGLHAARHPGRLRDAFLQARAMAQLVLRDEVVAAARCSLNASISGERAYRVVRADVTELKRIKSVLGGTVNDVILSAVTGGLRALLLASGDDVPAPGLRAMVRVSLSTAAERFGLGNKVSSLFVHLPVMEPDPGHRYLLVTAETADLKRSGIAELSTLAATGQALPALG